MARVATQVHAEKLIAKAKGSEVNPGLGDPNYIPLQPNQIQLYSYYRPSLLAGNYNIFAEQIIDSVSPEPKGPLHDGHETLRVYNRPVNTPYNATRGTKDIEPQEFEVVAPQFSLDPNLINSYYPPDGHQDEARILPHIVINDPHLPWERSPGLDFPDAVDPDKADKQGTRWYADDNTITTDVSKARKRSMVPWVAVMVFDPHELSLPTAEAAKALGIPDYQDLSSPKADIKRQPASGAFQISVEEYLKLPSRVAYEFGYLKSGVSKDEWLSTGVPPVEKLGPDDWPEIAGLDKVPKVPGSQEKTNVIFPQKELAKQLFADLESNKYLAHVRNINTIGFPNAGVEEQGLFSIVISGRTGPLTIAEPTTQVCHLVSLEHLDSTVKLLKINKLAPTLDRIGIISLFSWTYTALPPNPYNFVDTMTNVIKGMKFLQPRDDALERVEKQAAAASGKAKVALESLYQRLSTGYSIARWRAETGEETAAFNRGPLVPVRVPSPPQADWAFNSNTSKEYQILDPDTSLMDLSYSSAWQLGKVLAISDATFSSALIRFRSDIQRYAESEAKKKATNTPSAAGLVRSVAANVNHINNLANGNVSDPQRVVIPTERPLTTTIDDPEVQPHFQRALARAVLDAGSAGKKLWNEFMKTGENNSDWTVIYKWIMDKLYLYNIPWHYLIPDPTFLPEESLRFFFIDDNWMDCLIDGALSVGNHLEKDDDRLRNEIKATFNFGLKQPIVGDLRQQIPCYGFILRSQIVKVMPDMRINIQWHKSDERREYCQWIRPDDHTLICLLDRMPEELEVITLVQPPHQQRFSLGHALREDDVPEFKLHNLYTREAPAGEWVAIDNKTANPHPPKDQPVDTTTKHWFDGLHRLVKAAQMAEDVNNILQNASTHTDGTGPAYIDMVPNSAELAMELNDPAYYFRLWPTKKPSDTLVPAPHNRQLRARPSDLDGQTTIAKLTDEGKVSDPIGGSAPAGKKQDEKKDNKDGKNKDGGSGNVKPVNQPAPDEVTRIPFKDGPIIPLNPSSDLIDDLPKSCFTLVVYPDYKGRPEFHLNDDGDNAWDANNFIPTENKYLFDLIFSVRKNPLMRKNDQSLREIIINIPHDGLSPDTGIEPLLKKEYIGPARIISNQRFVPFLNQTETHLQVRLVPRSADEHPVIVCKDKRTTEISFRLANVKLADIRKLTDQPIHNGPRTPLAPVEIDMYERFVTLAGDSSPGGAPVQAFVAKKATFDVDEKGNKL